MSNRPSRPSLPRCAASLVGALAFTLLTTGTVACGGDEESAAPASPESASESSRRGEAPSGSSPATDVAREAEQQVEILQGTLPKGFPTDVPRYPGAKAENALSVGGTSFVTFSADASVEEVLDYYRRELQTEGWSVRDGGADVIQASKGGRQITVRSNASDAGAEFALSISGG